MLYIAVIGKPDEVRGQIVKASIVLRADHAADDATQCALQDHRKHLVAPYKYLREIEFVPVQPKTISGKIRRFKLRLRQAGEISRVD